MLKNEIRGRAQYQSDVRGRGVIARKEHVFYQLQNGLWESICGSAHSVKIITLPPGSSFCKRCQTRLVERPLART